MALLPQNMQQPMASGQTPQQEQGGPDIPPEVIDAVENYIAAGMKMVHGEQTRDKIIKLLQQSPDPMTGAAQAAVLVMDRIEKEIEADDTVRIAAGNAILGEIIMVAETAGIHKYTDEQRAQTFQRAVQLFVQKQVASGKRDPRQLAAQIEELKQMQGGANGPIG